MLRLNWRRLWENFHIKKEVYIAVGISILIAIVAFAALAATYPEMVEVTFQSSGVIKTADFKVYYDEDCQNPVGSIDWGMIEPGFSKNITIYVKNNGNTPLVISINTSDWQPPIAEKYINISLIAEQPIVHPKTVAREAINLYVSKDMQEIITYFNCTITIVGVESATETNP